MDLLVVTALIITFIAISRPVKANAVANTPNLKKLLRPVYGPINSPFGDRKHPVTGELKFHNGVDFPVPVGTPVFSPGPGTIKSVYYSDIGGNQLIIQHDDGFKTGFAHLSKVLVKVGDKVDSGKVVAFTGNTGRVTGPHLHFTVTDPSGNKIDPEKVIHDV